jgi:hypothetical protein
MLFDPDTEIQYRKGGKIMKKTPRKFQAGGTAPAPAPKPAPKGGPKELQDEAARLRQEARDKKQQEAAEKFYEDKQRLGNKMKKGGKVKKFAEGGGVREGEHSGIDEETRARVRNFLRGDLEEPKTAKPTVRKAAPKATPKAAPKAEPKKEMTGGGSGATEPDVAPQYRRDAPTLGNRGEKADFNPSNAAALASMMPIGRAAKALYGASKTFKNALSADRAAGAKQADEIIAAGKERAANARREAEGLKDFYQAGLYKKGGKVAKYAKGGGIESKGKTKGKVVKMATGGSVRGYGISKVTNKTKYC